MNSLAAEWNLELLAAHAEALDLLWLQRLGAWRSSEVKKGRLFPGACDPYPQSEVTKRWWYDQTWWMETTHVPLSVRPDSR